MLPLLHDLQQHHRPKHKHIEDRAGDGALVGIARDEDGKAIGVEILAAMVMHPDPDDDDEELGYALVNLFLDPEVARQMAMTLTMNSIFAEEEIKEGGKGE